MTKNRKNAPINMNIHYGIEAYRRIGLGDYVFLRFNGFENDLRRFSRFSRWTSHLNPKALAFHSLREAFDAAETLRRDKKPSHFSWEFAIVRVDFDNLACSTVREYTFGDLYAA